MEKIRDNKREVVLYDYLPDGRSGDIGFSEPTAKSVFFTAGNSIIYTITAPPPYFNNGTIPQYNEIDNNDIGST